MNSKKIYFNINKCVLRESWKINAQFVKKLGKNIEIKEVFLVSSVRERTAHPSTFRRFSALAVSTYECKTNDRINKQSIDVDNIYF